MGNMKITKITHWIENLELSRPYTIAYTTISDIENCFVGIETDTGHVGWGSAAPGTSVSGETMADCRNALENHLEELLSGAKICHLNSLTRRLRKRMAKTPGARAAVDMALYYLAGKWRRCLWQNTWAGSTNLCQPPSPSASNRWRNPWQRRRNIWDAGFGS